MYKEPQNRYFFSKTDPVQRITSSFEKIKTTEITHKRYPGTYTVFESYEDFDQLTCMGFDALKSRFQPFFVLKDKLIINAGKIEKYNVGWFALLTDAAKNGEFKSSVTTSRHSLYYDSDKTVFNIYGFLKDDETKSVEIYHFNHAAYDEESYARTTQIYSSETTKLYDKITNDLCQELFPGYKLKYDSSISLFTVPREYYDQSRTVSGIIGSKYGRDTRFFLLYSYVTAWDRIEQIFSDAAQNLMIVHRSRKNSLINAKKKDMAFAEGMTVAELHQQLSTKKRAEEVAQRSMSTIKRLPKLIKAKNTLEELLGLVQSDLDKPFMSIDKTTFISKLREVSEGLDSFRELQEYAMSSAYKKKQRRIEEKRLKAKQKKKEKE